MDTECEYDEEVLIQYNALLLEKKLIKELIKSNKFNELPKTNLYNNNTNIDCKSDNVIESKVLLYKPSEHSKEEYNEMKAFLDMHDILYKEESLISSDLNVQNPVVFLTPSFYIIGINELKERIEDIKIYLEKGELETKEEDNQDIGTSRNYCSVS